MPKTLSLLAVLKKIDTKGLKSLSDPQWNTFLASDTEPNEIQEKITKLEGFEEKGAAYDATGELIVEDNQALIDRFKKRTGRAKGRESLKVNLENIHHATPEEVAEYNASVPMTEAEKEFVAEESKFDAVDKAVAPKKKFKVKKSKIDVKSFKEKFLDKDEEKDDVGPKDMESKVGRLARIVRDTRGRVLELEKKGTEETEETEGLKGIRDVLDDILKVLRLDFKGDRKEARDAQKKAAQDQRDKKEGDLEKKEGAGIGKAVKAMLSPFSNIWKKILNFLKFALIGVLFNTVMKWFSNPANEKKVEAIGRFFKDWWPALATAAALFLTPLGALVAASVNLMAWAIPALLTSIAANPWAAAILATGATAAYLSTQKNETDKKVDESVEKKGKEQTVSDLKEEKASKNVFQRMGGFFTGEGQEREEQIQKVETGTQKRYGFFGELPRAATEFNKGGVVPGSGNKDTVPAMLTPGEFVVSAPAVQKYGVDTFASLNAMGGGTNKPEASERVVMKYGGGGLVDDTAIPMIKQHEGLRLKKYIDSRGFPTIGYGHLVDRNENIGDTITESQADSLFEKDYEHHKKAAMRIPGYTNASVQQKAALIDLTFNMGPGWVDGFPKFKKAFASGNYDAAANELINSNWYNQVNTRGPVIVNLIRETGGNNKIGDNNKPQGWKRWLAGAADTLTGNAFDFDKRGGGDGTMRSGEKEPVGTPIVNSTHKTITLPTIPKQQSSEISPRVDSDVPSFRIPIVSSQRSMVLSSLGIRDLVGG